MTAATLLEPQTFGVEAIGMTKRFGSFTALDNVSVRVAAGSLHALLGENGAGKSTLVKCIMGYYRPDEGEVIVGERQQEIDSPRTAHVLGLGMVYQHFTLVPSMTVAENFVLGRPRLPGVIDWKKEHEHLERFFADMPFRVPLDVPAGGLSAGEKQKAEIVKQLYLGRGDGVRRRGHGAAPRHLCRHRQGRRGQRRRLRADDARHHRDPLALRPRRHRGQAVPRNQRSLRRQ
jgi:ABC-type Fe3+/spermidine/putrescine transport system ATPase subunit